MSDENAPAPEAAVAATAPVAAAAPENAPTLETIPEEPKAAEAEAAPPTTTTEETKTPEAGARKDSTASTVSAKAKKSKFADTVKRESTETQSEPKKETVATNKTKAATKTKKSSISSTSKRDSTTTQSNAKAIDTVDHEKVIERAKKTVQDAERLMEMVTAEEFDSGDSEGSEETLGEEESESSDSVGSYIQQKELEKELDFFEVLGQIPSIDSISLDQSLQAEIIHLAQQAQDLKIDTGRFTDPLTGRIIISEASLASAKSSRGRLTHDDGAEEEAEEEEEEGDEFDYLLIPPEIEEDKTVQKADDGLDLWYSMEAPQVKRDTDIDFEEMIRAAQEQAMLRDARSFLDALVDNVVDKCEYIDPNTILRQNLDKKKLVQELQDRLADLDVEQKARFFLNRKTVEYFRRKKAFRSLLEDSPETITQVIEKYKEATTALDQLLGREEETKNSINFRIENLEAEMRRKEEEAQDNVLGFEELIRKTLHRDNFEKLKYFIENQLQKMAKLRGEISKIRLVLIQRQHTLATLIEKSDALDNLGEGLHMKDFEHLQTETQALGKKIEERNSDLNKLRTRCNADLHIMAHLKEKQQMMRNTITIQEGALLELIEEKQQCRESLYNLKVERGKIRNEIHDLSFQGGLIDKPALMLDYDETEERLVKLRAKVEGMRQKHSDLQHRIHELEATCREEDHEDDENVEDEAENEDENEDEPENTQQT